MLEYAVIIGLILGAGYWIISPLLKPAQFDTTIKLKADDTLRELELKKEGAYSTIRELEFDSHLGKLSKKDYNALKQQYMLDAVNYIKEIDKLQKQKPKQKNLTQKDIENEIEKEILALRGPKSEENSTVFCTQCGAKTSGRDRFCSACGTQLSKPDLVLS